MGLNVPRQDATVAKADVRLRAARRGTKRGVEADIIRSSSSQRVVTRGRIGGKEIEGGWGQIQLLGLTIVRPAFLKRTTSELPLSARFRRTFWSKAM